ncbi:hypothetical protein EP331_11970 [bacterium]|nr:MAG: hypothetical protein EP331_11970 [bacterium]
MLTKREWIIALEWAFVVVVASSMFIYGGAKPVQFSGIHQFVKNTPVKDLEPMQLMWAFYGYSQTFPIILGIIEVLGGILLIIRPTRLIGAFLLTGVLSNIIIQDIIYEVNEGALYAAIIYQIMIFGIFIINSERVFKGLKVLLLPQIRGMIDKRKWMLVGVGIIGAILLKYLEWAFTH